MQLRYEQSGTQEVDDIGESTSGKLLDHWAWKLSAIAMVFGNDTEVRMGNTYGQGESGKGEGK
jgi:hypothetical protein